MKIKIRQACSSDSSTIAKVVALAIGEETSIEYCGENYLKVFEEVAKTEGTQYSYMNAFIAEVDGNPAGAVVGYDGGNLQSLREKTLSVIYRDRLRPEEFPDETQAGEYYLDSLGVFPEFRGHGIGRMLLEKFCEAAFAKGFRKVGLMVGSENIDVEKMYLSAGFYRLGIKSFFGHKMWHMQMISDGVMSEKEKMLSGMNYSAIDGQLTHELNEVKLLIHKYNQISPTDTERRTSLLKNLFGYTGDDNFIINQPFYCDYGKQISIGKRFFANFNLTILDEAFVTIGDDCFIGPNVSLYTACHSTDPVERNSRREWARPITIGDNVWIGGGVTVLPGVTIGNNVTIGAGSVVTKDIPDNVVAVGNPCKVIKHI